ncbi:unnamed protein product [Phaedon cochleariae]|uniref:USP domain-containing protein n=1 Tax=Phaedon cochleariae TaxID=80249 RepID=A0A9N9X163_PHACE|nr:unnamed protein product [Phaedon cochleariae]
MENIQPFLTLQLNVDKVKTINEALVNKEQLEGLTSPNTNGLVQAWQQLMLDVLPVILILHLKFFDFKPDVCTRIIKALEFPVDLEIESRLLSSKSQTPDGRKYMLFAVVYHFHVRALVQFGYVRLVVRQTLGKHITDRENLVKGFGGCQPSVSNVSVIIRK